MTENNHELLMDIPLNATVELGRTKILVRELLSLKEGSIVELKKLANEPLDFYVNEKLVARGEPVMAGEKFGIKLTEVISQKDRMEDIVPE